MYNLYTIKRTDLKVFSLMSSDNCVSTHVITTPSKTYRHRSKKLCQKVASCVLDCWDFLSCSTGGPVSWANREGWLPYLCPCGLTLT